LRFDAQSLRLIDNAEKYLIVDIIYNTKRWIKWVSMVICQMLEKLK
jgi:hypothetical protein